MSASTKRRQQLQAAREAKRQKNTSKIDEEVHGEVHGEAHWEGLTESEEESDAEFSDSDTDSLDGSKDAFERLVDAAKISLDSNNTSRLRYQRSKALSERQQRRVRAGQRSLTEAAKNHSQPIARLFQLQDPYPVAPDTETANEKLSRAIADLQKKLSSKKTLLQGQNLVRHRAVLALLYTTQARGEGETREALSYQVKRKSKQQGTASSSIPSFTVNSISLSVSGVQLSTTRERTVDTHSTTFGKPSQLPSSPYLQPCL